MRLGMEQTCSLHRRDSWCCCIPGSACADSPAVVEALVFKYEPWSILTIWLMVIPSIIRILIMVIINPYEPLDD